MGHRGLKSNFFQPKEHALPCCECQGHRRILLYIVREHLIMNGQDPNFRVWRGPSMRDSSNEEWEEHFRTSNGVHWGNSISR
jgi:hypothetical protein